MRKKTIAITPKIDLTKKSPVITVYRSSPQALPNYKQLYKSCMSYFDLYRTDEGVDELGIIDFTQEGLNKISDVGMFNAIGVTRYNWKVWGSSTNASTNAVNLRKKIEAIEQILEQVDQQRLSSRGNVGDVFRMKAKHKWRDKDTVDANIALTDLSSDKTAQILKRISEQGNTNV